MPDVPEEYYDGARNGEFPAHSFMEWLNRDADQEMRDHVEEAMDENNMSLEWATMTAFHDIDADPHNWDNVTISRDIEGEWAVIITDGGETTSIRFDTDDIAEDMIWADLYWHLQAEGIEFQKDVDS